MNILCYISALLLGTQISYCYPHHAFSVSVYLSVSVYISISFSVPISLSLSLPFSYSVCLSLCLSLSCSLYLPHSLFFPVLLLSPFILILSLHASLSYTLPFFFSNLFHPWRLWYSSQRHDRQDTWRPSSTVLELKLWKFIPENLRWD